MRTIGALLLAFMALPAWAESDATRKLRAWADQSRREIVQVSPRVHTAIGYTVSANSVIVGDDGVIIVDPGHLAPLSKEVRAAFEEISDLPVRAIVLTHGHPDHTGGTRAFLDPGADVEIWARSNFGAEMRSARERGLAFGVRPAQTQGGDLPDDQLFLWNGIRPMDPALLRGAGKGPRPEPIRPTRTFSEDRIALEIAGVKLELVAAPGETDDQLYIWLPDEKVLFAGDNVFHSWPNVYPLRGAQRSIRDWIASLGKMIDEGPERMVVGHGPPVLEGVVRQLTQRRDAMQWVLDRTLWGANRHLTPDALVDFVRLPEHFAELDHLESYYGSLEGTVRQIYAQELGWFDGDPLNLHRDPPAERARRMAKLLGGKDELLPRARKALAEGDERTAAELAQHAMRLDPEEPAPRLVLADALEALAEQTLNVAARNYSLSYAQRLRRGPEWLRGDARQP